MSARVKKLKHINYENHEFDYLWVILDKYNSPPLLPLIFTTQLCRFGIVYGVLEQSDITNRTRTSTIITRVVSSLTIRSYVYCLAEFLSYLDECKEHHQTPGMHASSACSQRFVRNYLNQVLPERLDSFQSLENSQAALRAYYCWLEYMEICPCLDLKIYRRTRQMMAEKSRKQHYIQYVTRYWRTQLLNNCETLAEKLIIRLGCEVGLRTSELMGLRIENENGLLSLFKQLEHDDYRHINQFSYWLHGRYTKGDKSRWIYFDRELLLDMKRYFQTERRNIANQTKSKDLCFFLRTDQRFGGTGIKEQQGTNVFRKRARIAGLNPLLTYHDLRHTFATELYHEEIVGPDGRETRSESAALIVVAQRLGHSIGRDGKAPAVTTKYIRMRIQMIELEDH